MVQKKTKYVQIENVKDVYVTSDGKEFDDEYWAEHHEFTDIKLNRRSVYLPDHEVCDYECLDDLLKFIKDTYYSDTVINFDYNDLEFPNTYVLLESVHEPYEDNGYDDVWIRETTKLDIMTLEKFKEDIINNAKDFK